MGHTAILSRWQKLAVSNIKDDTDDFVSDDTDDCSDHRTNQ
jgi:hypothetical protein